MSVVNEENAVKMDDLRSLNTLEDIKFAVRRIDELEAKLAKAVESLTVIDALDPEGFVNGCSQSALKGLVLRMGEVARTTLAELKGQNDE
jgi:hypothetical protein